MKKQFNGSSDVSILNRKGIYSSILLFIFVLSLFSCFNYDNNDPSIAPSNLQAKAASFSQIDLSWQDNSYNGNGFRIERRVSGDNYSKIAKVSTDETSYIDSDLESYTTYYYLVISYNDAGNSEYSNEANATTFQDHAAGYIADYTIAKESVLRSIPESAIIAAKKNHHIMYCGTTHSSQTVDGMRGLMQYKNGDDTLFGVTSDRNPLYGSCDIHYRPSGVYDARDLSHDRVDGNGHTFYYYKTIEYLDSYPIRNVVMLSWCSIEDHDVLVYLNNYKDLIDMYRVGGFKERTELNAVTFVFMTGYALGSDDDAPEPPYLFLSEMSIGQPSVMKLHSTLRQIGDLMLHGGFG